MQVVPVEEQPAPVSGVVVGVVREQPGASEGREGSRGSLEFLGRWKEKQDDRAMPIKLTAERETVTMVRVALGKLIDELVQNNASSGTLAISCWTEIRGRDKHGRDIFIQVSGVSWSASPDDVSYQRHGFVGMEFADGVLGDADIRLADFEGVVDDFGEINQNMAVYRVALPSRGLDPEKWVGRPPPPAPADLYTGPRSDGLLSTGEISGEYSAACACGDDGMPAMCNSMSVVPLGADAIETWRTGCIFFPPLIRPTAEGAARTRDPGTNTFDGMTFSAGGTTSDGFKKRPGSQKRAFHKVETRDLAGNWRGCGCVPFVPLWPFSHIFCTRKKALNEDQYEESGRCCVLVLPIPVSETRTRIYANGHPTNCFDDGMRYRDPGCAGGSDGCPFFAKKVG
jgi:hypothetical protein